MRISRDTTSKIVRFFDNILPPFVRDSEFIMSPIFKILFKDEAKTYLDFKNNAHRLTEDKYQQLYQGIKSQINRDTCLNRKCLKKIIENIKGTNILEVGVGNAYLANILSEKYKITGVDISPEKYLLKKYPVINFVDASIEKMSFKNKSFDTTICTHTLEHVMDIESAINKLRNATKKRLIIVVPKQRPYKYTFDFHLHFFPYEHSLLTLMKNNRGVCFELQGDLFYMEDIR